MAFYETRNLSVFKVNNPFAQLQDEVNTLKGRIDAISPINEIDTNADSKLKTRVLNGLYQNGLGHKGIAVSYGNAKTGKRAFTSLGVAKKDGTLLTEDTCFWAYSNSRALAGLIIAKVLEDGIIPSVNTPLSTWVPEFTGNAKVISSVTIPAGQESNPAAWTYTTSDYNLASMSLASLMSFSFGWLYQAYYTGQFNPNFMFNPSFYTGLAGRGDIGKATGMHLYLLRQYLITVTGQEWYDIYANRYTGMILNYRQTLTNMLNLIKSGTIPMIFAPGSSGTDVLPFLTTTVNSNYGYTFEIECWGVDAAIRAATGQNFAQYAREKFLTPMGLDSTYFVWQEAIPQEVKNRFPEYAFRRTAAAADPATITTVSIGLDPSYAGANIGNLVWESDFPNDGLVKAYGLYAVNRIPASSSDIPAGGIACVTSIKDLDKVHGLVINDGVYNGRRLINSQSMKWYCTPKVNALSDTWTFYGVVQVDPSSSDTAGPYRMNRDIVTRVDFPASEFSFHGGGGGGSYCQFDIQSGYYCTIFCPEAYSISYSQLVNGVPVDVSYRNLATTSRIIAAIMKQY